MVTSVERIKPIKLLLTLQQVQALLEDSFLKPYEQLEAFAYSKMPLYKQWKTPKGVVEHLLSFDERLLNTHTVVNELRSTLGKIIKLLLKLP